MVVRKLVAVACVVVMLAALGFAQGASTGDLHITVRDPKGSLVTNATVTARDEAKGLERATSENTDGQYHILLLPPAQYTVTVEAPGFARATVQNVVDHRGTDGGTSHCLVGGGKPGSDQCEFGGGTGGNATHLFHRHH